MIGHKRVRQAIAEGLTLRDVKAGVEPEAECGQCMR